MRTRLLFLMAAAVLLVSTLPRALAANMQPGILPIGQIQPGMKGVALTIYSGDAIQKIDLTVIGVLPNALAPKTSIILVKLEGAQAQESGVVAGMSGSPVYIEGKLVGAIALKLGVFTKDAIAGVMPIEQMLAAESAPLELSSQLEGRSETLSYPAPPLQISAALAQSAVPESAASLIPIQVPLAASGISTDALARFSGQLSALGFVASGAAGSAAPRPDDKLIQPGDMAAVALVQGDLSLSAGCTVTAILENSVFLCGHPILGSGQVSLPLVRAHVVTTLSSALESTKIISTGGPIGTVTEDRSTAVIGRLGPSPATIPVTFRFEDSGKTHFVHFSVAVHPKLTPVLMGLVAYNALINSPGYNDNTALRLQGRIEVEGHSPILLQNVYAPSDLPVPDGFVLASGVQAEIAQLLDNPFGKAHISNLMLDVTQMPSVRSAAIENAWSSMNVAHPGERVVIKVLLRPYREVPFVKSIVITIPPVAVPGTLRVLVSDASALNQMWLGHAEIGRARPANLDALIQDLNQERQNDRLYVTLLQPTPTLILGGKELPDIPLSVMQVLNPPGEAGGAKTVAESRLGEWSQGINQVVTGQDSLSITVQ